MIREVSDKGFLLSPRRANSNKLFYSVLVRLGLVPAQVEPFCWLAVAGKVSTANNLRRGLASDNISDVCYAKRKGNQLVIYFSIAGDFSCKVPFYPQVWAVVSSRYSVGVG